MDLERVLLTVLVIILHLNNRDMGGGLNLSSAGAAFEIFIRFLESAAICAVDAFLMLSGYFAARNLQTKANVGKAVFLLITCSFYRVIGYVCFCLFVTHGSFSIRTLIGYLIPNNWYVCLFVTVLLLSPFLVRLLNGLDGRDVKRLTCLLVLLFSVVPTFVTLFGEAAGADLRGLSTVTWQGDAMGFNLAVFVTCYVLGWALRCSSDYWDRFGAWFYLTSYLLTAALASAISHFTESIWNYSCVLTVTEAAMLTLAFTRIHVGSDRAGRVISALAGCSLGIFLWHTMPVMFVGFWERFGIVDSAARGFASFAATCVATTLATYAVSAIWVLACRTAVRKCHILYKH